MTPQEDEIRRSFEAINIMANLVALVSYLMLLLLLLA